MAFSTFAGPQESLVAVGELYRECILEPSLSLRCCLGCLAFYTLPFPRLMWVLKAIGVATFQSADKVIVLHMRSSAGRDFEPTAALSGIAATMRATC
jgi:hypothetical protein